MDQKCEIHVYLCEQNQSSPLLKNTNKSARSQASEVGSEPNHGPKKTSSLEKLRAKEKHLGLSPSRAGFFGKNRLTPWRSLKDLTKISNSDTSVNNLAIDSNKDCFGSTNNIDTDCVSPRVSSNSLASIQVESLDLTDTVTFNLGSHHDHNPYRVSTKESDSSESGLFANNESVAIYTQKRKLPIKNCKSSAVFSRSTSCPLVLPAGQTRQRDGIVSNRNEFKESISLLKKQVDSIESDSCNITTPTENSIDLKSISQSNEQSEPNNSIANIQTGSQIKPNDSAINRNLPLKESVVKQLEVSTTSTSTPDKEKHKKQLQSTKILARSKCMQWLNSLDEGD
ncbi:hypothetical protein HELRODRAFT_159469 [Helobdella robusta]|uniref:Uncharacterized protein n=1 Tax=Helobdella robusta TaxID=6412 RepID=T1EP25_HELRO|nr:hypothetical protein HELRODRAFT_159469 [Helobdella robusta]ESO12880.1 hypothetical protein HELRODRAFT_159469 [Helobdella robusta]